MTERALDRLQAGISNGGPLAWLLILALCLVVGAVGGAIVAFLPPLLSLGLVVALIGGLMMLRSTQVGLFALIGVIALIPFAAIPVRIGFYPTFLDAVLVTLFLVWITRVATRTEKELVASPLSGPILVFILLAFASFVAGTAHANITKDTLRHFVEVIISISLFFVVVNCVRSRRQLEEVVTVIILAGFLEALIGVVLYLIPQELTVRLLSALRLFHYPAGWGVLRFIEDNPELPLRAIATSIDPNVLGGLLILVTSLTAPQLFAEKPLIKRVLIIPILVVMGVCMLLTFSRGAFAGLGLALLFIGGVRYRRLLLLMAIVLLVLFFLPQTQGYIRHFQAGLTAQDLATQMRLGELKDAFRLISRYPWFGVGFGAPPDIDLYIGVSNVYLLIAEEMGIIGLAAFLLIMLVFFLQARSAWRRMAPHSELEPIFLGLIAALLGALVGGLFDHYFFNLDFPHSVALFWLYVGLAVTAMKVSEGCQRILGAD